MALLLEHRGRQIPRVIDSSADGQLPSKHLFLHQVLHSADLHLVYVVHKAGPIGALVPTLHGLRLADGVNGEGIVVSGGHAVAAVTDTQALESR